MRACLLPFLLALLLLFAHPAPASPAAAERIDTEIEKLIGKQVAWALVEASGQDTDPLLVNWIRRIGEQVAAQATRRDVNYTFNILGTDIANAYAAPGGYIYVTRGLLDTVDSDDELASVLAHETAHVVKRHAMQQIGANLAFLTLVNSVPKIEQDRTLRISATVLNILRTLHKSREMEAQADEIGIVYAAEAGYNPEGLVRFFDALGGGKESLLEQYLSTHPSPERRTEAAQRSPLVTQEAPQVREEVAGGYARRGLRETAEAVRRGESAFTLPAPKATRMSEAVREDRQAVEKKALAVRRSLTTAWRTKNVSGTLQQVMLINNNAADLRWSYVAARAYAVQANVDDLYARTLRTARTAPATFDALAEYADAPPGTDPAIHSALGRAEAGRALERLSGATKPLERAAQAVAAVLVDLNNTPWQPRGSAAWLRYGTLEGLLQYAEGELSRADKASGEAWRILSLARIRRYQARLDALTGDTSDPARRSLWYDMARRRLGRDFPPAGSAGAATVRAALVVQLNISPTEAEAGRGSEPWADWTLEKKGIPENIATFMRLLTLDLERETAARDRHRSAAAD